jgi:basic membrane lipoprotein Med (substrate-binding protein (PBP1-ABC) superfamily)
LRAFANRTIICPAFGKRFYKGEIMKKRIVLVLLALCAAAVLFAAPIKVGFVTDTGGIDDKSFNQGTWEALRQGKQPQGRD